MADTTRDVELRIRASNLTTPELKEAITNLNALTGSLESQARAAKAALTAHQEAMKAGTASGKEADATLKSYERTLAGVDRQLKANKASLEGFNAQLRRQSQEALRAEVSQRLNDFNARVEDNRRKVKQLQDFNAETKRLTAQRHADETKQARQAADDIRRIQQQGQQAQLSPSSQLLRPAGGGVLGTGPTRGAGAPIGFLGLRPYELTNLGYQINDVISGLVSGQNATQILAQQGGQFIQIFGRAALRWFPLVAAAVGGVALGVSALTTSLRTLASNREFEALLSGNKYVADQTAVSLTALRKEVRDLGVSWEDAGKAIRAGVEGNIRPERLREVTLAARDMARVNGIDLPEAMKALVEGISGGIEAFDKLLVQFPKIGDENAKRIRELFILGKAEEAQVEIVRVLGVEYAKAGDIIQSKLDKSVEKLSGSWNRLLDTLSESKSFDTAISKLTDLVQWVDKLIQGIDKFIGSPSFDRLTTALGFFYKFQTIPLMVGGVSAFQDAFSGKNSPVVSKSLPPSGIDPELSSSLQAMIADAASKGIVLGLGKGFRTSEEQAKLFADAVAKYGSEAAARKWVAPPGSSMHEFGRANDLRDSSGRAIRPGSPEDMYLRENAARFGLVRPMGNEPWHIERIGAREGGITTGRPTPEQDRAAATAIRDATRELEILKASSYEKERQEKLDKFRLEIQEKITNKLERDHLVDLEGAKLDEERNRVEYQRQQERTKQQDEDRRNALDVNRIEAGGARAVAEAIKAGRTNYEELYAIRKAGEADARNLLQKTKQEQDQLDAAEKRVGDTRRQLLNQHKSALEQLNTATNIFYDEQIKQLEKLAERGSTIDKAKLEALKAQTEESRKLALAQNVPRAAEATAREALSARDSIVAAYTKLEQAGEISITERDNRIKEAFNATRDAILGAADAMEKFLRTSDGLSLPETEILKITARIKELRAEVKYIDPWWKGFRETAINSFTSGLETAFNSVSEAIGGAIAKTKEWKDVFVSVKQAGIQLFAQLLKDIATYILKAEAAKIASSFFGGGGGGGGLLSLLGLGSQTGGGGLNFGGGGELGIAAEFGVAAFRRGGIVGRAPSTVRAPASWWDNAPRYRTGAIIGLAPDEQRAILHRGEEVLSADNPRNILNGGGRGGISIRNVLVDDRARIPEAMTGAHGERVIIQHLVNNAATVREIVR